MSSLEKFIKEFEKEIENNFKNPRIDSNGDLFLQVKYDDDNEDSMQVLRNIISVLLHQYDTLKREEIEGMREKMVGIFTDENRQEKIIHNKAVDKILSEVFKGE